MYTVGVYADRTHEVRGLFTGRKVRGFPPDVGDCIVGQAEVLPAQLVEMARRLCRELRYHGLAEFEFKRDAMTDEFKLIEVNPRSWSWVGITPACGVSLPWLAYRDLMGTTHFGDLESTAATGNIKWVRLLDDMLNCLHFNRLAGYPEWHMAPREWLGTLRADRLVTADLAWDDPVPSLYSLYLAARRFAGHWRNTRR
jgi:predicted ATP-grasp superfamily ATP-dependent carboligase